MSLLCLPLYLIQHITPLLSKDKHPVTFAVLDLFLTMLPDDFSSLGPVSRDLAAIPAIWYLRSTCCFLKSLGRQVWTWMLIDQSCTKLILISAGKGVFFCSVIEADTKWPIILTVVIIHHKGSKKCFCMQFIFRRWMTELNLDKEFISHSVSSFCSVNMAWRKHVTDVIAFTETSDRSESWGGCNVFTPCIFVAVFHL